MTSVIEPAVRGFPPVPEVAWVHDAYVAPPVFTDAEPVDHRAILLVSKSHLTTSAETGLTPTEEPIVAAVPATG